MLNEIVNYLIDEKITISTMESCTGGLLASLITDVKGASEILKFSAVTYSDEYKIKMGVKESTIAKHTVYSEEVSKEMAYNISKFSNSILGVGITGKLASNTKEEKSVNICIYDSQRDKYYHIFRVLKKNSREENKMEVIKEFTSLFNSMLLLNLTNFS